MDQEKRPREIYSKEEKRIQAEIRTQLVFAEANAERSRREAKTRRLRELRMANSLSPQEKQVRSADSGQR